MNREVVHQLKSAIERERANMVVFLETLVSYESPSLEPDSQTKILSLLQNELEVLGLEASHIPGLTSGGSLIAEVPESDSYQGKQLLVGHCDTVWPRGTIKEMPFVVEGNVARGPGIYDMKSGLTQIIFALKAIHEVGQALSLAPLVLINSDEEIGSRESKPLIIDLAQKADRAMILEPALGLEGRIKTQRKGVGKFRVSVEGRASHAGLQPEKGISAILEMSHIVQKLFSLNDFDRGISVNVGKIEGGLQANVIAPSSSAEIDVRVPTMADAASIEKQILGLKPAIDGSSIKIEGGIERPPLEKTAANVSLWEKTKQLGSAMGLDLNDGLAGGGSDGNYTSQFTATIDGLGAVGDGAHARHEFIYIDKMVERTILLSLLLLAPPVKI